MRKMHINSKCTLKIPDAIFVSYRSKIRIEGVLKLQELIVMLEKYSTGLSIFVCFSFTSV